MSNPDAEVWRDVPGYEGRYEVSSHGHVRSLIPWRDKPVPRLLQPCDDGDGYGSVTLYGNGGRKTLLIHRLVMQAFVGPRPDGMEVRHLDGEHQNNRIDNLAYGTRTENNRDLVAHGRHGGLKRTHCPRGHEYTEANTIRNKAGHRECRECKYAQNQRYHRDNAEQVAIRKREYNARQRAAA